jgi:phosphatidylglycerophosphatase A
MGTTIASKSLLANSLKIWSQGEMNSFILLLATGFGIGRFPLAPGTLGSVLGLFWFAALLQTGNYWAYLLLSVGGIFLSVWLSGAAERILGQSDPAQVIIDEIVAVPLCFSLWTTFHTFDAGEFPTPEYFFSGGNALLTLGVFLAFRLFDIVKPWPVAQSQNLPGGWGVTFDDVLAAVYVNLTVLVFSVILYLTRA